MDRSTSFPSLAENCWFLTGPTASGKSAVGVCVAERIDAEILSLDSMAVYQRMDLGTAKPSAEEQSRISHCMLDLVTPDHEFSVSDYLSAAHRKVDEITARGKQSLFVGGSPMYLKGCLRGFDVGPPANWEFREAIEKEIDEHGLDALRQRLAQVDPLSAHQLHPNDKRRMIRALEVAHITGQPISHRQVHFESHFSSDRVKVFALHWPREQLHRRIEARVERMFASGLVDEVAQLRDDFSTISRTAFQAVGYKEVFDHLDGKYDLPEAIEQVKAHSRQLARRQETWFRSTQEVRFIEMSDDRAPEDVAGEIVSSALSRASS